MNYTPPKIDTSLDKVGVNTENMECRRQCMAWVGEGLEKEVGEDLTKAHYLHEKIPNQ